MINVGTLSKLRRMVRRDGLSVREASKKLGIARNTAARWLAMDEMVEPKYPKRVTVESILDPYKEQLINWLKTDSHRGKRDRRTTKALFEAVRALGYSGSRGPVYEFCKHWRAEQLHKPRHAGFVPMSYELGEAFQFDWSCEYAFVEGLRRRLEVAHIKLAASRAFVMVAYYTQSHEMLFDAHSRAFEIFGVYVTEIREMDPEEFDGFKLNLGKSRDWLKGKGGDYWDGRLCVMVHAPGRPYLFIDPSGGDSVRYLARLG